MKSNKILPYSALASGSLMAFTGMAFVVMYILEAILARVGDPDQSLMFWYLPILFMGLIGMVIGLGICVWGTVRLRKVRPRIPQSGTPQGTCADPKDTTGLKVVCLY